MWHDIHDHDEIAQRFRRILQNGRLASTYLFSGPHGIGKRLFAHRLAQCLLCLRTADHELRYCGACDACRLIAAGNHPDLLTIGLPEGKNVLPIELFVGDREHRHQAGLCHHLSLKPYVGVRRVAVIDDADHFNQESANSLLKTLEEPPPNSLLVLIGTSPSRQLPTIRSRAQLVRFRPLAATTVVELLVRQNVVTTNEEATRLAEISEGSLERARALADPELWRFRDQLIDWLEGPYLDPVRAATGMLEFVEAAGKESAARRDRLRTAIHFAIEYYRNRMRRENSESLADQLDRSLATLEHIDRNANQASLVHWWLSGLGGPVGVSVRT
jgi:DNA polymerase-3 subunit delta'